MSQFGIEEQPIMTADRKTSGLAIGSLICSLIFCCPVTTVLGVLLGLGALVSIGSNPAKKGKGLAITGILIGVIATIGTVMSGKYVWDNYIKPIMDGPREVLTAGFAGDPDGVRASMHGPAATATDEEIAAFFDELTARYGAFQSVRIDETAQQPQPQPGAQSQSFPYVFEFSDTTVSGEAEMTFSAQGQLVMKWSEIVIIDDENGDLIFPATPTDAGDAP